MQQFSCHNSIAFRAPERAIKHEYDIRTKKWSTKEITVSVATTPFQEGTNRTCYLMKDFSQPAQQDCVAKIAKNPKEERKTYFSEIEMQCECKTLAQAYNNRNPTKRVDFIVPFVVEFPHKLAADGKPMLMGAEVQLKGAYKKFSNNFGFVADEGELTPQAFSHFTYEVSNGTLLVCDIQGVDGLTQDTYTDPQIHSSAGNGVFLYGNGDIGSDGIREFFATHRCNGICRSLALPDRSRQTFASSGLYHKDHNGRMLASNRGDCSRDSSIGSRCSSNSSGLMRYGQQKRALPMQYLSRPTLIPPVLGLGPRVIHGPMVIRV